MDENRLIAIEIKLLHHERTIEDLSDVMIRQQKQIDLLQKHIDLLNERLRSEKSEPDIGPADEKPPHY